MAFRHPHPDPLPIPANDHDPHPIEIDAADARQGEIILKHAWSRWVFIGALIAFPVIVLLATLAGWLAR